MPLPRVMGEALVDYLRGERPATDERRVFVKHLGMHHGMPISSTAVSGVVARALRRAAVDAPLAGAYVFPAHRGQPHGAAGSQPQRGR